MRRRIAIGAVGLVVVLGAALWWFVLRNDAPPPPELSSPTTTVAEDGAAATTAPPTTSGEPVVLEGEWSLVGADSFVGYRVKEELARIGFTEAVGRTSNVTGSLEIAGTAITAVEITVDMASLQSDSSFRDSALRGQALETNQFPTATFSLAEPIELGSLPTPGEPVDAVAVGDLTIHGVTNRVEIPIDAQLIDSRIEVVATLDIVFADYDIDPPSAASVLSVENEGDLEMQLFFARG